MKLLINKFMNLIVKILYFTVFLISVNAGHTNSNYNGSQDLSGVWQVTWNDGTHGNQSLGPYILSEYEKDPGRFIDVPVPMDLHRVLMNKGLIDDLNFGTNSLNAAWVSQQYWLYNHSFNVDKVVPNRRYWLVFDKLDLVADIYLNDELIGRHENYNYPCRLEITGKIISGKNKLRVAINSGLFNIADKEGSEYSDKLSALTSKWHWLRKPSYQFGWDWNPRLINVGITGAVTLEWSDVVRLDQTVLYANVSNDLNEAELVIKPFIESHEAGEEVLLNATIQETGQTISQLIKLQKGIKDYPMQMIVKNPKLWWPRGYGEAFRYTVNLSVESNGEIIGSSNKRLGVRKVDIDQSEHPVEGKYFTILINNVPIFLNGGNWVPPELLYSEVDRDRISSLMDLAIDANFNCIRIWGGGTWAGHDFLEYCDENGIVVWHDFLFAVAEYPGTNADFLGEIRKEVTWAVREFSNYASLILWCGNNEVETGYWNWGNFAKGKLYPDYAIYHMVIPRILVDENPSIPYWPSSPFSPDYKNPADPTVGDQHPWGVPFGKDGANFWAYRNYVDRFPNEGGVMGASLPKTLRQFLPDDQEYLRSFSWEHHENSINLRRPNIIGVNYEKIEYWLGRKYDQFDFDTYAFASGLLQAEGFTEYIANYSRRMFSSSAAIFWMFNDSWPTTHSWSIVDYYLRKKLAFHPVRRGFSPIKVVVAKEGGEVIVFGINQSPYEWKGKLRSGIFASKGGLPINNQIEVTIPKNSSVVLDKIELTSWEDLGIKDHGAFASLLDINGNNISQYKLLLQKFKDFTWAKPKISIRKKDGYAIFEAENFVWGVCIDLTGESAVADNMFDLIPGLSYKINDTDELPKVLMTGNDLFHFE